MLHFNRLSLISYFALVSYHSLYAFQVPKTSAPHGFIEKLVETVQSSSLNGDSYSTFPTSILSKRQDARDTILDKQIRETGDEVIIDSSPIPDMSDNINETTPTTSPPKEEFHDWMECEAVNNPDRTISLSADYYGSFDNVVYFDKYYGLFKFGLGFTDEDILDSKMKFIWYMRRQFGLDIDISKFQSHPLGYMYSTEQRGMIFAPVIFNMTFRIVADSQYRQKCADSVALMGGWMIHTQDVVVKGILGGDKGILYNGDTIFMHLFLLFSPGTRDSKRIEFFPYFPFNCNKDGACVMSGITFNYEDNTFGSIDGSIVSHLPNSEVEFQQVIRLVAMWPGRFYPTYDMEHDIM